MSESCTVGAGLGAALQVAHGLAVHADAPRALYELRCIDRDGRTRWCDRFANTVVTVGRNDLLTQYFKGSAYTAAWFVGLIDDTGFTSIAAGDTMASHAGWTESTAYAGANRASLALGAASGGSIDNAASLATFAINATAMIRGAFIASGSAKGGAAGTLYSAGTFAATRSVAPGDTLNITVTLTAA